MTGRAQRARPPSRLPAPGVRFSSDFVARLERLRSEVRGRRSRWEGSGRGRVRGAGTEFVGYRPYRAGEDVRRLDWDLYGRLNRPFVRVTRRESSERWVVVLDTSASMGVGPPGKLQWAAEVAAGIVTVGLGTGAELRVVTTRRDRAVFAARRATDLWGLLDFLADQHAEGDRGAEALLEPASLRGADRVVALGDWVGVDPGVLRGALARGREASLGCVLAPTEVADFGVGGVEWVDAETGERQRVDLDASACGAYERLLDAELLRWRTACARHRVRYGFWTSDAPFEEAVGALLEP